MLHVLVVSLLRMFPPDLQGLARAGRDNRPGDDCSEAQTSGKHFRRTKIWEVVT